MDNIPDKSDPPELGSTGDRSRRELQRRVAEKQARLKKFREEGEHKVWFGLGMFGLVGWSVAIPTLLGIALGVWIDANFNSRYSWTLMLLFLGVAVGSWNAWYWINRERGRDHD